MDMSTVRTEVEADPPPARERRVWKTVRNVVLGVLALVFAVWLVLYITKGRFLRGPGAS